MEKEQIEILISKYINGELSDVEMSDLQQALKDPVNLDLFTAMCRVDLLADRELKSLDWTVAWSKFEQKN